MPAQQHMLCDQYHHISFWYTNVQTDCMAVLIVLISSSHIHVDLLGVLQVLHLASQETTRQHNHAFLADHIG